MLYRSYFLLAFLLFTKFSCAPYDKLQNGVLNLNNEGLSHIPKKYLRIRNEIVKIDLGNNNFHSFPTNIFKFKNLEVINLNDNDISIIPDEIYKLQKLKAINIMSTNIRFLPTTIKELKELKLVNMIGIGFNDDEIQDIQCSLPKNCEVIFFKNLRNRPPYNCQSGK